MNDFIGYPVRLVLCISLIVGFIFFIIPLRVLDSVFTGRVATRAKLIFVAVLFLGFILIAIVR
jgi:hypothetical protein